jgi:D-glycerate 3-kinase
MQGPQGIGKTTLTAALESALVERYMRANSDPSLEDEEIPARSPVIAALSLDDFYLPYHTLVKVAKTPTLRASSPLMEDPPLPPNKLLNGRGHPGTHDIALLQSTLSNMSRINIPIPSQSQSSMHLTGITSAGQERGDATSPIQEADLTYDTLELPQFDKSLHMGKGDRAPAGTGPRICGPIDIVVLEGWCMGFNPLRIQDLRRIWNTIASPPASRSRTVENEGDGKQRPEHELEQTVLANIGATFDEIAQVNSYLRNYAENIYPFFSGFIQVRTSSFKLWTPQGVLCSTRPSSGFSYLIAS